MKVTEVKKVMRIRSYDRGDYVEYYGKPRAFFSVKDESVLSNLACRTVRPTDLYRSVLPEVYRQIGLPDDTKARWSRKAGCKMCPCSPGFYLTIPDRFEPLNGSRFDVYVTVEGGDARCETTPEALATIEARVDSVKKDPTLAPFLIGVESGYLVVDGAYHLG